MRRPTYGRLWIALAALALIVVLAASLLASSGEGGELFRLGRKLPGADKTGHLLLMGGLSFLMNMAFGLQRLRLGPLRVLKGTLVALAVATLEEGTQLFLARRTFSIEDLTYSYAGALLFGWLAILAAFCANRWRRGSE